MIGPAPLAPGAGTLLALAGEGEGLLHRALGDRHALDADREARLVHHREHAGEPAVLLADEVADRAFIVAEHHGAGGRGVNAHLVLDAGGAHVVAGAERAVVLDQELRHQEQRNPLGAGRARREAARARDG